VLALGMTWSGHAIEPADSVLVVKTERRLYLIRNGERYASFPATFGSNSRGHKQEEGDGRTPEGRYVLDYKNANSAYHLSIHVSYPNERDIAAARKRGVSPGGDIMVHGQKAGFEWLGALTRHVNWTEGCIALSNEDMATVWNAVSPGTPIEIRP
jgi:murein L,D-transpeptidase YafK